MLRISEQKMMLIMVMTISVLMIVFVHRFEIQEIQHQLKALFCKRKGQHDELEAKFFEERAALETKYQKLYQPLYTKRYDIVNGVIEVETTEAEQKDESDEEKGVPNFWLAALKNNEIIDGEHETPTSTTIEV